MVRDRDQDSFLLVPEMDVAPALTEDDKFEFRQRLNHFPRRKDGKPRHHSDLDFDDPSPFLARRKLKENFVVLSEPLGQVTHGLFAGLPLIRDVRHQVRRYVPLALLLDLDDGLHDLEWIELGI